MAMMNSRLPPAELRKLLLMLGSAARSERQS
jgi:hypothetical protein